MVKMQPLNQNHQFTRYVSQGLYLSMQGLIDI
jgi:hypothetical protein